MCTGRYVVFMLGTEEFGLEITCAKEIIRIPEQITKMPNMPSFFEGVINLRDNIIPVIDLKKRFGYAETHRYADNRLLILDLENTLLGVIVDDVEEVLMLDSRSIEKIKFDIPGMSENSIHGIAKHDDRLIVLLNALKIKDEIFQYMEH
ncbi:purine-binding chemotaxis protein CheW [Ruminiclostridium sufflavum DSM 19573]|uniref:Purine-binding chemotaxis protein CheW n=1 Tax=Ruminiclostridium sufflavum DSM 19573 TaxID=1121337 RepID=A0A318XQJ7_9FIRM|nr:chemotaxis protein CheW [Ruminiclostridium sufflavum]PYG89558.1 purine-binding chemotaxis protein CheW [Ruminiclostridium sufflavum DSM 19573]